MIAEKTKFPPTDFLPPIPHFECAGMECKVHKKCYPTNVLYWSGDGFYCQCCHDKQGHMLDDLSEAEDPDYGFYFVTMHAFLLDPFQDWNKPEGPLTSDEDYIPF